MCFYWSIFYFQSKYKQIFLREKEEYDVKLSEFKVNHPDLYEEWM